MYKKMSRIDHCNPNATSDPTFTTMSKNYPQWFRENTSTIPNIQQHIDNRFLNFLYKANTNEEEKIQENEFKTIRFQANKEKNLRKEYNSSCASTTECTDKGHKKRIDILEFARTYISKSLKKWKKHKKRMKNRIYVEEPPPIQLTPEEIEEEREMQIFVDKIRESIKRDEAAGFDYSTVQTMEEEAEIYFKEKAIWEEEERLEELEEQRILQMKRQVSPMSHIDAKRIDVSHPYSFNN
jgi:hypothetical protein